MKRINVLNKEKIYMIYANFFAKKTFIKWNLFLFNLSLRGLGILNWKTDYLSGEKDWTKNYLKNIKNPFIIDVGAHVGGYSKFILENFGTAKIIAFEPHPNTYKKLQLNLIEVNLENFQSYNIAIGREESIMYLYDHEQYDGSQHATLYKEVITDIHKSKSISTKVKVSTLDNIIDFQIPIIHILKIDTEGHELDVLKGAKELLQKHKVLSILFEFNSMNTISKTMFKDFYDYLEDYDFFRILPGGQIYRISSQYNPLINEIYAYQNIVALLKREFKQGVFS